MVDLYFCASTHLACPYAREDRSCGAGFCKLIVEDIPRPGQREMEVGCHHAGNRDPG